VDSKLRTKQVPKKKLFFVKLQNKPELRLSVMGDGRERVYKASSHICIEWKLFLLLLTYWLTPLHYYYYMRTKRFSHWKADINEQSTNLVKSVSWYSSFI